MQVFMMTPRSYKCCGQFVSVVRLPAKDFSDWRFVAAVLLLLLQLLLLLLKDSCNSWKFVTHTFLRYRDVRSGFPMGWPKEVSDLFSFLKPLNFNMNLMLLDCSILDGVE